ncbi:hypothetical protein B566_EDAN004664, partial [Ephemera danica]
MPNVSVQAQALQAQQAAAAAAAGVVPGMVVLDPNSAASQTAAPPPGFIPLPEPLSSGTSGSAGGPDTTQPPPTTPVRNQLPGANPLAAMVPPFGMPGVPRESLLLTPLGLTLNPGLVPLGVPPPGVSGLLVPPGGPLLHQSLLGGVPVSTAFGTAGSLLQTLSQIPLPSAAAPQDKSDAGLQRNAPALGVAPPTKEANLPNQSKSKEDGMEVDDMRKPPPPLPKP